MFRLYILEVFHYTKLLYSNIGFISRRRWRHICGYTNTIMITFLIIAAFQQQIRIVE